MSETITTSAKIDTSKLIKVGTSPKAGVPVDTCQLAIWAFLATVSMLFAAFASAYLVRREGLDWLRVRLPDVLWVNTILLLASSATIEAARAAHRQGRSRSVKHWLAASTALGVAFLAGQLVAWSQLTAQGVYLPSNPYSSFFYMLTAVHGVHLLGGILALSYLLWRVSSARRSLIEASVIGSCAIYWHFVDGLWVFLYLLLLY